MFQLIIPGLESSFGLSGNENLFSNPQKAVDYFEYKGYIFLSDWNSGKFLKSNLDDEPYVPERICLPSGKILDERELLRGLEQTKVGNPLRKELEGAFYYYNALLHESMNTKRHEGAFSFVDVEDEKRTFKKYRENPFFN